MNELNNWIDILKEPHRECLINGAKVPYTALTGGDLEEAKALYKNRKYIGSGNTYYINGVKNISKETWHYFV